MVSGNPEDDKNICANPRPVKTSQLFKGKKAVVFAVPGALWAFHHYTDVFNAPLIMSCVLF